MSGRVGVPLPGALRLLHVTDGRGDVERLMASVTASVAGGVRAVQVREPSLGARELGRLCTRLRPLLAAVDGVLLVNDRADLVAAGLADGVHLGHRSLAPAEVRGFLGQAVIGFAAHDPDELAVAAAGGADYATLSPIHPTTSKPGGGGRPLGVELARRWTAAADLPVLWLGGFDRARIAAACGEPAAGFAVLGALTGDPAVVEQTARELVAAAGAGNP